MRMGYQLKFLPIALLVVCCTVPPPLAAADLPTDEVTRLVRTEMQRQHIPGLALLVSRNGRAVRTEGYGRANVELQVAVQPGTLFQSGSVGKQFTATAVMMLSVATCRTRNGYPRS
jgi:CubicO group peptidase (beta-lactamase class C family)